MICGGGVVVGFPNWNLTSGGHDVYLLLVSFFHDRSSAGFYFSCRHVAGFRGRQHNSHRRSGSAQPNEHAGVWGGVDRSRLLEEEEILAALLPHCPPAVEPGLCDERVASRRVSR